MTIGGAPVSDEPRSSSQRSWSVLHLVRQKNSVDPLMLSSKVLSGATSEPWLNSQREEKGRVAMTAEQTSWTEALVGPIGLAWITSGAKPKAAEYNNDVKEA